MSVLFFCHPFVDRAVEKRHIFVKLQVGIFIIAHCRTAKRKDCCHGPRCPVLSLIISTVLSNGRALNELFVESVEIRDL